MRNKALRHNGHLDKSPGQWRGIDAIMDYRRAFRQQCHGQVSAALNLVKRACRVASHKAVFRAQFLSSNSQSHVKVFGDDTKVFAWNDDSCAKATLHEDLNRLHQSSGDWQLCFHPEKCSVLRLGNLETKNGMCRLLDLFVTIWWIYECPIHYTIATK